MTNELKKFAYYFHQDILIINDSMQGSINEALNSFSVEERAKLREFLQNIADKKNVNFLDIWRSCEPAITLKNEVHARIFLEDIVREL